MLNVVASTEVVLLYNISLLRRLTLTSIFTGDEHVETRHRSITQQEGTQPTTSNTHAQRKQRYRRLQFPCR
jgi:hypothetical protein